MYIQVIYREYLSSIKISQIKAINNKYIYKKEKKYNSKAFKTTTKTIW